VEPNKKYDERIAALTDLFKEAKAYCSTNKHETENLKLAAMCQLIQGKQKLFIRVGKAKAIIDAVNFANSFNLPLVIVGGGESWMVTDLLKKHKVAVVLNKTHALPNATDYDIDLPYKLPKLLKDAGVLFCISVGSGWDGFWDQRNLAFEAGTAAAYGLTKEEALMAITYFPALIMGIEKQVGTLTKGKDATIVVSTGDILDMRSSHIEYAFIQGRQVNLDNKQKALYRKFMTKYGLEHKQH